MARKIKFNTKTFVISDIKKSKLAIKDLIINSISYSL